MTLKFKTGTVGIGWCSNPNKKFWTWNWV